MNIICLAAMYLIVIYEIYFLLWSVPCELRSCLMTPETALFLPRLLDYPNGRPGPGTKVATAWLTFYRDPNGSVYLKQHCWGHNPHCICKWIQSPIPIRTNQRYFYYHINLYKLYKMSENMAAKIAILKDILVAPDWLSQ